MMRDCFDEFLYDYISDIDLTEEFEEEHRCAKLEQSDLFILTGFNLLSDYKNYNKII
jgi:hypothetical protein